MPIWDRNKDPRKEGDSLEVGTYQVTGRAKPDLPESIVVRVSAAKNGDAVLEVLTPTGQKVDLGSVRDRLLLVIPHASKKVVGNTVILPLGKNYYYNPQKDYKERTRVLAERIRDTAELIARELGVKRFKVEGRIDLPAFPTR